ncbi:MAG: hypothetical protein AAF514_14090, partial [Verrucomicrobiota bacterium]
MVEKNSTQKEPEEGKIKRLQIGLNVVAQIVMLTIIVLVLNWWGCSHYRDGKFFRPFGGKIELSDKTLGYLESLDTDVNMIIAFQRGSDVLTDVKRLVEAYRENADGRIKVSSLDPVRDPNRANELVNKHKVLLVHETGLLPARVDDDHVLIEKNLVFIDQFIGPVRIPNRVEAADL